jgi:uncharacterized protein with PQ loop repeat
MQESVLGGEKPMDWHNVGVMLGNFATVCFTLQYIPQMIKNYKRQSVQGFSTAGIIMKLLGASFLTINAYILGGNLNFFLKNDSMIELL